MLLRKGHDWNRPVSEQDRWAQQVPKTALPQSSAGTGPGPVDCGRSSLRPPCLCTLGTKEAAPPQRTALVSPSAPFFCSPALCAAQGALYLGPPSSLFLSRCSSLPPSIVDPYARPWPHAARPVAAARQPPPPKTGLVRITSNSGPRILSEANLIYLYV